MDLRQIDARTISQVTIHASRWKHGPGRTVETNLSLIRTGAVFVATGQTVPEARVADLWTALQRPPRQQLDPVDLGLSAAWLATNHLALLDAFRDGADGPPFPLASAAQRSWLTNALGDPRLLGDLIRDVHLSKTSQGIRRIEVRFLQGDMEILRAASQSTMSFMLPWEVSYRSERHSTYSADISRAVAAMLPEGFLNQDRLRGDLKSHIVERFSFHYEVQEAVKQMTLAETLGEQTNRLSNEFTLADYSIPSGNYGRFPDCCFAALHRTNWPPRLMIRVQTPVDNGVVRLLPALLDGADARAQPILRSPWLRQLIEGDGVVTIEVAPEGAPTDHLFLCDYLSSVVSAEDYDRLKPQLEQGLAFTLRERSRPDGRARISEWVVLPDRSLLLVTFAGDGVLQWTPAELGFRGDPSQLKGLNAVAVRLTPEGQIDTLLPEKRRPERQ